MQCAGAGWNSHILSSYKLKRLSNPFPGLLWKLTFAFLKTYSAKLHAQDGRDYKRECLPWQFSMTRKVRQVSNKASLIKYTICTCMYVYMLCNEMTHMKKLIVIKKKEVDINISMEPYVRE